VDWNLRSCARGGHVTYAPDEEQYYAKLTAETPLGIAWRCLRCGDYILGEPDGTGPADDAPVLLRGKALRSAFILRLLAVERWVRGTIILLLGLAVLRFKSTQVSLKELFNRDLRSLRPFFDQIHFNVSDSGTIKAIDKALAAHQSTLNLVAAFLIFYGALQLVEGLGLWLLKRWGEYFAVVATSIFIPLEVYELTEKITWLRIVALLVNVAAVVYLLVSKRLFGLRGGHAAYEAEQHEASLLEVETSSTGPKATGGNDPTAERQPRKASNNA
jgi:uncharacterized membrane protein (DUF2068 family)